MDRETKTIKLANCEVDIIKSLTWGEREDVQDVMLSGAKVGGEGLSGYDPKAMREAKYKLLEIAVHKIKEEGEEKEFSKEWMNNLSVEDGDKLYSEIEKLQHSKN